MTAAGGYRPAAAHTSPNVILVDNFFYTRSAHGLSTEISPHLGLMTLAAMLEAAGRTVEIFDPKILFLSAGWRLPDADFFAAWADRLSELPTAIIGFTAYGRTLPYAVRVAQAIKQTNPRQTIIIGGPHATIVGRPLLEAFDCFDVAVRYEAEPIIVDLVDRLGRRGHLGSIPNLIYRQGERVVATPVETPLPDMDMLPRPALHKYPAEVLRRSELSIEAGRGCPFACTFCSTANFFRRRYRLKSNQQMIAEMEDARATHGVSTINLNHDLFGLHKPSLREFCVLVKGRGFNWKCSMRPDTIDLGLLRELREAGCSHIYFGIETGSRRLQFIIKKRLDLAATRETLRHVAASGVSCTASFIVGFPEETEADLRETLDLIGELIEYDPSMMRVQLHLLSPEPGSELADGDQSIAFDGIGPEADDAGDQDLIRAHPELFSVFYHYGSLVPRLRNVYASAFVTYLIPKIGVPLVAFMCRNFFAGRLSAMFDALDPAPPSHLSFDGITASLWRAAERLARRLASTAPYLPTLIRFSAIADAVAGSPRSRAVDSTPMGAWIVKFDCDILKIVEGILARSKPATVAQCSGAGEYWYSFQLDTSDRPTVIPVDVHTGRALEAARQELSEKFDAESDASLRELGAFCVWLANEQEPDHDEARAYRSTASVGGQSEVSGP